MKSFKNNRFAKAFKLNLEADISNLDLADEIEQNLDGNPEGPTDSEDVALKDTLDTGVSPEDYLTDPEADKELQRQINARNKEIASVIEDWVNKIENFKEFLNGTSDDSLQSILAKAQPGTLFAKVQANNARKLANSAQTLAELAESLKSFLGQKAISTN